MFNDYNNQMDPTFFGYQNDPYAMQQMQGYDAYGMPMGCGMQEFKAPPATDANLKQFMANYIGVPVQLCNFVKLTESLSQSGVIKHPCVFSLLSLEEIEPIVIQYFDKATIEMAVCRNCFEVIYYVEKY